MRTNRSESRAGFMRVALLVVVGITGVLVGMLLPAAQQLRESARSAVANASGTVGNLMSRLSGSKKSSPYLNHEDVGTFSQSSTGSGIPGISGIPGLSGTEDSSPYVNHDGL